VGGLLGRDTGSGRGQAAGTAAAVTGTAIGAAAPAAGGAVRPLGGGAVRITGGLLRAWQQRNREATIPHVIAQLRAAGNVTNLSRLLGASPAPYRGRYPFLGTDLYKTLEGRAAGVPARAVLIPYFLWGNRDPGSMRIWITRG
jgi:hypothetical protein